MVQLGQQVLLLLHLWWLGFKESLRVHRCVLLVALDEEGLLFSKILECTLLHGGIFLGSLAWWSWVVKPVVSALLTATIQPVAGVAATAALESTLDIIFQGLWLAPAYLVTLIVSCTWYNELAQRAVQVQQQHAEWRQAAAARTPSSDAASAGAGSAAAGKDDSSAGGSSTYEEAAQQLYRVTLFMVFYLEVWLIGWIPAVGPWLYLLFSCWLYAYYCFDYQWTLKGIRVQDRLALFEGCAPFFAGYGLILSGVTMALPFYVGAAIMSLLFPVFVLVACDSNVAQTIHKQLLQAGYGQQAGGGPARVPARVPVFSVAAWPTQFLLRNLFGQSSDKQQAKKLR